MSRHDPYRDRDLAATVGLSLYSLAVAIGFARVFSGWDFLTDLIVLIVVGHGSSFALRKGPSVRLARRSRS